jgi:hypothetical protein
MFTLSENKVTLSTNYIAFKTFDVYLIICLLAAFPPIILAQFRPPVSVSRQLLNADQNPKHLRIPIPVNRELIGF